MVLLKCCICGHGEAVSLGQIPDCGEFAGQKISPSIKGGELWLCKECGSMFRHPTLSQGEYLKLYEKASSDIWVGDEAQRKDFETIYTYLQNHYGGSVLDIGCYAGKFLAGLPENLKKYGLEPSKSAAKHAIAKGINILGKTLSDLDNGLVFDVVVSIDVVEHVVDVEKFLNDALSHVSNDGLLILSSGNPNCFFWRRIFKAKFWYSSYPEHLVFPSFKYFCEFSKRNNLPRPEQICFKYGSFNFRASFFGFLHQLVFTFSPTMYRAWIKLRRSMKSSVIPVTEDMPLYAAGVFTDHHVIIFRKRKKLWD